MRIQLTHCNFSLSKKKTNTRTPRLYTQHQQRELFMTVWRMQLIHLSITQQTKDLKQLHGKRCGLKMHHRF